MNFKPSSYQKAIFDWMSSGSGHAIINAVAGSGKTTTLVEASKLVPDSTIVFAAFNKHIVKELRNRLPNNARCFTIHSIAWLCIVRYFANDKIEVDEFKYRPHCINAAKQVHKILQTQYENTLSSYDPAKDDDIPDAPPKVELIQEQIETVINLARCTLTDVDDIYQLYELVEHFAIDCPVPIEGIQYVLQNILSTGETDARENKLIDFTDMLWLCYKWKLQPGKYDWIMVDEAQDLNAAQLNLVRKMADPGSRFLFVGDPFQAIYGFSGADARSFDKIKNETNAIEYPLSICYRCPKKVVELASTIVPNIEAAPTCIEGFIYSIKETDIQEHLKDGDLVLCRSTEPLLRTCFKLLAKGIKAVVKGRDVCKSLVGIVKQVAAQDKFKYDDFLLHLENYAKEKAFKLRQKANNERKIVELSDQIASIAVCFTSFNSKDMSTFIVDLDKLFSDEKAGVVLSTVHKVKGLEEERIFILYPEKLPLKWDKQKEWQLQQETNLKYVALTRSKHTLYLVAEAPEQNVHETKRDGLPWTF